MTLELKYDLNFHKMCLTTIRSIDYYIKNTE